MKIELNAPNSFTREISVEVPWDEVSPVYEKTERDFIKKIKLPGFRPGRVPRRVIDQQFKPAIQAQFIDDAVQRYYLQALTEQKLQPVNQAKVEDINFEQGNPLSFKAIFEVEPEIELPELKKNSLKVERTVYETSEEDVDLYISEMQERLAEVKTVEDGSREGDFLVVDLQKLDDSGVPIIGEKFEQRYIKIGDGIFSGEMAQRLVGLKSDDTTRIDLPEAEGGATHPYELKVINVEQRIPAEVNEEFIKQLDPEARDEADFRTRIKDNIDQSWEQRSDETFERSLSEAMIKLVEPEYPPSMVEAYLDRVVQDAKSGESAQQMDEENIRRIYRPVAENNLKWYLIHNALIKQQEFAVTDEDVDQEIDRLAERSPGSDKEIRKYYRKPSNRKKLSDDLLEKQILAYLKEFAKIKEQKVKTSDLRKAEAQEHRNG